MAGERRTDTSHSKIYYVWKEMRYRCTRANNKDFRNYGARGITVCERWRDSFENFLADMGEPPTGLTLDRIDNDGDYSPANCRWATKAQQVHNRRPVILVPITFNGETRALSFWARRVGINTTALRKRIENGWPLDIALTKPSQKQHCECKSK